MQFIEVEPCRVDLLKLICTRAGHLLVIQDHLSYTECWKIPQKFIFSSIILSIFISHLYICTTSFSTNSKILSRLSFLSISVCLIL